MSYQCTPDQVADDEILCSYHLEPAEGTSVMAAAETLSMKASADAAGGAAAAGLLARVFEVDQNNIKAAFPARLFEGGNIPQLLSVVAGKIFGLDRMANLRLQDVYFPKWWIKSFTGPTYGSGVMPQFFGDPARPLVSALISPEAGLDLETYLQKAEACFVGGCDIVRDSPQMVNWEKNSFDRRVETMLSLAKRCAEQTGMSKHFFPSISGPGDLMRQRAEFVAQQGGLGVCVNFQAVGYGALQMIRNEFRELVIYGDRTSHAATARNKRHGISMTTLGKLARLAGADLVEIGSITGDMVETEAHVVLLHTNLLAKLYRSRDPHRFDQEWHNLKNSLPVTSGGLTARDIRELRHRFGNQLVVQIGRSMTGREQVTRQHVETFLDELGPLVPLV